MTKVTESRRRPWAALGALVFAALAGAACFLIYMSAAFADRNFDGTTWRITVSTLAGLTLAALSSSIIFGALRVRPPRVWFVPGVAFLLPIAFFALMSLADG